jgi:hypothetical protein
MDDAIFLQRMTCREVKMKLIPVILLALSFGSVAQAGNIENGDDLHFENCTGCHDSSVYTRENRNVRDLARLGQQVRFCKDMAGLTWFDDEVQDVIEYLNASYYHF